MPGGEGPHFTRDRPDNAGAPRETNQSREMDTGEGGGHE